MWKEKQRKNIQGVNQDVPIITPPFLINKVCADKKIGVDTIQKWQGDRYASYLLCSSDQSSYLIVTVNGKKLKHVDDTQVMCLVHPSLLAPLDEHLNFISTKSTRSHGYTTNSNSDKEDKVAMRRQSSSYLGLLAT